MPKPTPRVLLWILAGALIHAAPLIAADASADPFARALDERMPALLAKYHVPGAVVSCITNGDMAWTKAFGLANVKTRAPMRPDMVFNHASNGKFLTTWGIMRLVEKGKLDLDAPANRYLKRWQLRSEKFDPNGVTIRRLLSHSAGLTVHGFSDYDQRRRLPDLVEMLEGNNQIELFDEVNGPVLIRWEPGTTNVYSGGGYLLLQMVIEDITGESFVAFMRREVTVPLGVGNIAWFWAPEFEDAAPMPCGELQEEVGYRQLACQSIGGEICTVPDFARFVAATAIGPHGEPAGRGVLKPESVAVMLEKPPSGIGYGFSLKLPPPASTDDHPSTCVMHYGGSPGWSAHFFIDTTHRQGVVIANNSSLGFPFNVAVRRLWMKTAMDFDAGDDPPPAEGVTPRINRTAMNTIVVFGLALLLQTLWRGIQIERGKRVFSRRHELHGLARIQLV